MQSFGFYRKNVESPGGGLPLYSAHGAPIFERTQTDLYSHFWRLTLAFST